MLNNTYTVNRTRSRSLISRITQKLFRPVSISVVMRDRPYILGETMGFAVELRSKRNFDVREARVDLVCEEHYAESFTTMVPDHKAARSTAGATGSSGTPYPTAMFPRRETEIRTESYVHSSVVFATNSVLRAGIPRRYSVKLPVSPEPPLHSGLNNVKWTLVTTLRLHQGREFTEEQTVSIKLIDRSRSYQPSSPKVNGTSAVTMSGYLNGRLNRK